MNINRERCLFKTLTERCGKLISDSIKFRLNHTFEAASKLIVFQQRHTGTGRDHGSREKNFVKTKRLRFAAIVAVFAKYQNT